MNAIIMVTGTTLQIHEESMSAVQYNNLDQLANIQTMKCYRCKIASYRHTTY